MHTAVTVCVTARCRVTSYRTTPGGSQTATMAFTALVTTATNSSSNASTSGPPPPIWYSGTALGSASQSATATATLTLSGPDVVAFTVVESDVISLMITSARVAAATSSINAATFTLAGNVTTSTAYPTVSVVSAVGSSSNMHVTTTVGGTSACSSPTTATATATGSCLYSAITVTVIANANTCYFGDNVTIVIAAANAITGKSVQSTFVIPIDSSSTSSSTGSGTACSNRNGSAPTTVAKAYMTVDNTSSSSSSVVGGVLVIPVTASTSYNGHLHLGAVTVSGNDVLSFVETVGVAVLPYPGVCDTTTPTQPLIANSTRTSLANSLGVIVTTTGNTSASGLGTSTVLSWLLTAESLSALGLSSYNAMVCVTATLREVYVDVGTFPQPRYLPDRDFNLKLDSSTANGAPRRVSSDSDILVTNSGGDSGSDGTRAGSTTTVVTVIQVPALPPVSSATSSSSGESPAVVALVVIVVVLLVGAAVVLGYKYRRVAIAALPIWTQCLGRGSVSRRNGHRDGGDAGNHGGTGPSNAAAAITVPPSYSSGQSSGSAASALPARVGQHETTITVNSASSGVTTVSLDSKQVSVTFVPQAVSEK